MELRHLRYFVAAAEQENVTQAALKLHVSQPALSRQLSDLEEELGFPLFERSAKSVRLTEAGKTFLIEARAVLQRADEAVKTARAVATGDTELHVGYAPSPTVRIMPATLRAFQARYPKVRVRLHDLSTEEMLSGVREGKQHVAFLVRPSQSMLRGLRFEELTRDNMCVAMPPGHALARARSLTLDRVAQEPLVAYSKKDYPEYQDYLNSLFAPIKTKPRIAEEHDGAPSLIAAVESGIGLAIVPQSFSCFTGPRLKLVSLSPAPEPITIGAAWLKSGMTSMAEQFWSSAKEAVAGMADAKGKA